jgi:uncharacterized protein YuzE
MRLCVNKENDTLYLRLDENAITESEEVEPGIILDYDENGRVVGIEMSAISKRVAPEQLHVLRFETT